MTSFPEKSITNSKEQKYFFEASADDELTSFPKESITNSKEKKYFKYKRYWSWRPSKRKYQLLKRPEVIQSIKDIISVKDDKLTSFQKKESVTQKKRSILEHKRYWSISYSKDQMYFKVPKILKRQKVISWRSFQKKVSVTQMMISQ